MNERIRELQHQCWVKVPCDFDMRKGGLSTINTVFDYEKFAELIVADCLKQIQDRMVDKSELLYEHEETTECVNEALMDAHHNIAIHFGFAEHFGVEE